MFHDDTLYVGENIPNKRNHEKIFQEQRILYIFQNMKQAACLIDHISAVLSLY